MPLDFSQYTIEELQYVLNNPIEPPIAPERHDRSISSVLISRDDPRIQLLYEVGSDLILTELRRREKAIYGDDDRHEITAIHNPQIISNASATCAIIKYTAITDNGNGTSTLHGRTFQDKYNLCPTERFLNQPAVANSTAFLVDPSIVITAAHCIDENKLREYYFVFEFETVADGSARTIINTNQVYQGTKIIGRRKEESTGIDWAVIQLSRPVLDKMPARVNFLNDIQDGQIVYCIGHPAGIPKKIALNGVVSSIENYHFIASLDTYAGNSGSPVFNADSHLVEGILVRGVNDFLWNGNCKVSQRCMSDDCLGEGVMRANDFIHLIPQQDLPGLHFDMVNMNIENHSFLRLSDGLIIDFTGKEQHLARAMQIINFYGFDFRGTINGDASKMTYYLSNAIAPSGKIEGGEDQIFFNRNKIEVRRIGGNWKIVEEDHWILDFGNSQADARQALSIILRHQFNYICFVGRPNAPFIYFKA